jgi:hypothetical protein
MTYRKAMLAAALAAAVFGGVVHADKKDKKETNTPVAGEPLTYSLVGKFPKMEEKTILVPSALLHVGVDGDVWAVNSGGMFSKGGTAKAHGKYFVTGLNKEFLQDLARKSQEDLVQRLRAAGFTVKTYEEMKSVPEIVEHDRYDIDKDYGMPTDDRAGINYVIATPTDEQAFKGGLRTYVWSMRKLAKAQDVFVLLPQYNIRAPQMWGEKSSGYKRNSAKIDLSPDLTMGNATMYCVNAKQQGCMVMQQGDNRLIAEGVGEVAETSQSNYSLAGGNNSSFGATYGEIKGVKASYRFNADREKYAAGVMLAVTSFNDQIVKEMQKQVK